ncbi:MAG: DUF1549 domain-containing protein, partial [Planctomycetota bacterium]
MTDRSPTAAGLSAELADGLHAMHEGRLDEAGIADLERRILSEPDGMRAYLDLTAIHGNLSYAAGALSAVAMPALTIAPEPPPVAAKRWRLPATLAASIALLCGLAFVFRPQNDPVPFVIAENDGVPAVPDRMEEPIEPTPAAPAPRHFTPEFFPEVADIPAVTPEPAEEPAEILPRPRIVAAIDAALENGWAEAETAPSPVAEPGEWLRRAWLDLAGHAPPPEEVQRFLADESPNRHEYELDRLLSGDAFASHLAERWTTALVGRVPRDGVDRAGLRSHLTDQFARNVGWDLVAAELIAATGDVSSEPAANFLVAHVNNQAVPATAVTSRVLLGTQVQCMQCHDHPQNRGAEWSQERFWELNAFFKGADVVSRKTPDGV